MAAKTRSSFFFGPEVLASDVYFSFSEGGPELIATLLPGPYSPTTFAAELSRAMSAAGSQEYTVTFDRITRLLTISAAAGFEIWRQSGSFAGSSIWVNSGFTAVTDQTGSNSYTGQEPSGFEYRPQFFLLDFVPSAHRREALEAAINISASGKKEVVRYGLASFMECTIDLVNDYKQSDDFLVESNQNGVSDCLRFLNEAIKSGSIEFMLDRDAPENFEVLRLESTIESAQGIGFLLRERLDIGEGFYTTGKLIFRKVEF